MRTQGFPARGSMNTLWQDLRFGARMMIKAPGFTLIAVLSIALGIAVNSAVFTFVNGMLLKPMPVRQPDRLVALYTKEPNSIYPSQFSYLDYVDYRDHNQVFSDLFIHYTTQGLSLKGREGAAEMVCGEMVTGNYFTGLRLDPALGRLFTPEDDKSPGGHPVAVLSHAFWRRRFAGDPNVVGQIVKLNGHDFTIIGVAKKGFSGTRAFGWIPDVYLPLMMYAQAIPGTNESFLSNRGGRSFNVNGRLRDGVTIEQARAAMSAFAKRLGADYPRTNANLGVGMIPASTKVQPAVALLGYTSMVTGLMMGLVGLVLLVACANVANLLLARATARRKEIAVRLALGASRLRLIRQLLTESLLLAASGGALGLALAWWGIGFLLALMASGRNPVYLNVTLDARALMFTAAASVLACILFGLAPAWRATDVGLTPALKDSSRSAEGGARLTAGKSLVVMQVALSLSLLIVAGLFARSLGKLYTLDAGFKKENVLLVSTDPLMIGYQGKQVAALYQRLLERFKTIPGVRSASLGGVGLLGESGTKLIIIPHAQGRPAPPGEPQRPPIGTVTPEYFETVGMTILRGRSFTARDFDRGSGQKAVIVNEAFARYYFGEEDPIGQRFGYNDAGDGQEIVGVVKDAKHSSLREPAQPTWYGAGIGQD